MARARLVAGDVPAAIEGGTELDRLRRENRQLKSYFRDLEETYAGPPDAEGIAGIPSISIFKNKNVTSVFRHIDELPVITLEDGYAAAVAYARDFVRLAIYGVWLRPSRNSIQERDLHSLVAAYFEHGVSALVRPGRIGDLQRARLRKGLLDLGARFSIQVLAERGKEAPVIPVPATRRLTEET